MAEPKTREQIEAAKETLIRHMVEEKKTYQTMPWDIASLVDGLTPRAAGLAVLEWVLGERGR